MLPVSLAKRMMKSAHWCRSWKLGVRLSCDRFSFPNLHGREVSAMPTHRPNPRLVKINRSYTVDEIAKLFGIHKNTVREWIKSGLPVVDNCRPVLILGSELRKFLELKRTKNKQTCQPCELYCLRCRKPQKPAGNMADFTPITDKVGNLIAICPVCDAIINKRINMTTLALISTQMDITFTQAPKRIGDSTQPTVNSDFK